MIILAGLFAAFILVIAVSMIRAALQMRRSKRTRDNASLDQLSRWVTGMLLRFAPGACLIAESNDREGFLQLARTGREGAWRQLEFGLPDANWSRARFPLAVSVLSEGATDVRVEQEPANAAVPRFLRISIAGESADVESRAVDLLRHAAEVLEFPADGTYRVSLTGPDHPEYLRTMAIEVKHSTKLPRWITRRLSASLLRDAEALERR
jgi:hypothetical protein